MPRRAQELSPSHTPEATPAQRMMPFAKMHKGTIPALSLESPFHLRPHSDMLLTETRHSTPPCTTASVPPPSLQPLPPQSCRAQPALCKWFHNRKEPPARVNSPEAWRRPPSPSPRVRGWGAAFRGRQQQGCSREGAEDAGWPAQSQLESDPLRAHPCHPDLPCCPHLLGPPSMGAVPLRHPYLGRIRLCVSSCGAVGVHARRCRSISIRPKNRERLP